MLEEKLERYCNNLGKWKWHEEGKKLRLLKGVLETELAGLVDWLDIEDKERELSEWAQFSGMNNLIGIFPISWDGMDWKGN